MLILAFEANSALSHENEAKIVKITHSSLGRGKKGGKPYFLGENLDLVVSGHMKDFLKESQFFDFIFNFL